MAVTLVTLVTWLARLLKKSLPRRKQWQLHWLHDCYNGWKNPSQEEAMAFTAVTLAT